MSVSESHEALTRLPVFVDVHTHLRAPSPLNKSESYATGTQAAALGGYGVVADMPNTPGYETWYADRVYEKYGLARDESWTGLIVIGGSQPETPNINEIPRMISAGVRHTKSYAAPTTNNPYDYEPEDFEDTYTIIKKCDPDHLIMLHPGKENLEAFIGKVVGDHGLRLHVCHVEHPDQVDLVQQGKKKYGQDMVTSGVTPHHLLMTSHDTRSKGWFARMQPPLARQEVAEQLMERLAAGDIDVIETDHAPHRTAQKWEKEAANPTGDPHDHENTCYGVPGIEFAAQLMFNQVRIGSLSMERLVDAMSTRPAQIIGVQLSNRSYAEWDLRAKSIITHERIVSGAKWSPYLGMIATGELMTLVIGGREIVSDFALTGNLFNVAIKKREQVV